MNEQKQRYIDIIYSSDLLLSVLDRLEIVMGSLGVRDYLLSGGAVYQIVWNHLLARDLQYGLDDLDIVYYDDDLSKQKEDHVSRLVQQTLSDTGYSAEAVNQARVYRWNKEMHGVASKKLVSLEEAVASWMPACCCIGIRKHKDNLVVIAPYGLDDIFNLVVRPNNKTEKSKDIYCQKTEKWKKLWPELTVISW